LAGHRLRDQHDAILVGINTVLKDDPSLTTRIPRGRDPLRVIVDSKLRVPLTAKVLTQRSVAKTFIVTLDSMPKDRLEKLLDTGAEILIVKEKSGQVDLKDLMRKLGSFGINSVLIEGGSTVNASALKSGIVDKVVIFIAPILMTGKDSLCSIGGLSPIKLTHALRLHDVTTHFVGQDIMLEAYMKPLLK
jgi:diaminohydroxyphosphoribosylaminopyrimidine deaminase/5-amino-6-(5-phosphoribosylamino)uracil reductase